MLKDLQRVLARALTSDAPLETLRREAAALAAGDRAFVDRLDPDGFLLTSLLVRKLRFERLCRADPSIEAWFERDPGGFVELFRRYNAEVPPRESFPLREAEAFHAWRRRNGVEVSGEKM